MITEKDETLRFSRNTRATVFDENGYAHAFGIGSLVVIRYSPEVYGTIIEADGCTGDVTVKMEKTERTVHINLDSDRLSWVFGRNKKVFDQLEGI